ncbi:Hydra magnipapillata [Seminavis robusta]|uniref:Hydra magnipapillata n=1 Tax=Seminavis robusta TaxID=568900 RepID=A0A9N8HCJ5_9STRA|nr:Hydra magnipapillata [Seminavis robusta]|eukprot:Sro412_g137920.1 Hydra magnipapillata (894) ;mRNA; f:42278-45258
MKLFPSSTRRRSSRLFSSTTSCGSSSSLLDQLQDPKVHNPALSNQIDLLGVSVHHFVTVFLPSVLEEYGDHGGERRFMDIENLKSPHGFVRQKGASTKCPLDGQMGAAYVHTLQGEDHVGPSTAMLSWTWKYTVSGVVETLKDYCEEHRFNPKRTYIWMCCLCVNQHRVVQANHSGMLNKSSLDFQNEFRKRVLGIGRVLAMMGPWDDPEYLKRVWCIFECFTAIHGDVDITIVMPPKERERMSRILLGSSDTSSSNTSTSSQQERQSSSTSLNQIQEEGQGETKQGETKEETKQGEAHSNTHQPPPPKETSSSMSSPKSSSSSSSSQHQKQLLRSSSSSSSLAPPLAMHPHGLHQGGVDALYKALSKISVQNAQATVQEDKIQIMNILQESQLGFDAVNKQVANYLREWVRRAIDVIVLEQVDRMEQAAKEESKEILNQNESDALEREKLTMRRYRLTHAAFCTNVAMLFQRNGEFDAAIEMFQKSQAIYELELGENHAYTAATLSNIGSAFMAQGQHKKAEEMLHQAINIQKSLPEAHQKNMATTYANLAQVLHGKGDFDNALQMYKQAAKISEKFYGSDHQATAPIYSCMGSLLLLKGCHSEALVNFQNALEIFKVTPGENHPDTAKTYSDIGRIYHGQGDYVKALEMQDKAIAIQETVLGNHVHTATSYLNKARSLQAKGDYDDALIVYSKTRDILERKVGRMHPTTAATFCSLGSLYQAMKKYPEAVDMYHKALKFYEVAFGKDHFSTARVYSELGSVLHDKDERGDQGKALTILRRAQAIQEASLNHLHPSLATTYLNLGRVMKAKKDYTHGMEMYKKALAIQEKILGKNHPTTASTYSSVASLLAAMGKRADALAEYQKCLAIQKKVLGSKHPLTVKTMRKMKSLK